MTAKGKVFPRSSSSSSLYSKECDDPASGSSAGDLKKIYERFKDGGGPSDVDLDDFAMELRRSLCLDMDDSSYRRIAHLVAEIASEQNQNEQEEQQQEQSGSTKDISSNSSNSNSNLHTPIRPNLPRQNSNSARFWSPSGRSVTARRDQSPLRLSSVTNSSVSPHQTSPMTKPSSSSTTTTNGRQEASPIRGDRHEEDTTSSHFPPPPPPPPSSSVRVSPRRQRSPSPLRRGMFPRFQNGTDKEWESTVSTPNPPKPVSSPRQPMFVSSPLKSMYGEPETQDSTESEETSEKGFVSEPHRSTSVKSLPTTKGSRMKDRVIRDRRQRKANREAEHKAKQQQQQQTRSNAHLFDSSNGFDHVDPPAFDNNSVNGSDVGAGGGGGGGINEKRSPFLTRARSRRSVLRDFHFKRTASSSTFDSDAPHLDAPSRARGLARSQSQEPPSERGLQSKTMRRFESFDSGAQQPEASLKQPDTKESSLDSNDHVLRKARIDSLRKEARAHYIEGDYRLSIHAYSNALSLYSEDPVLNESDARSVLLANRAAALMMVGAYRASAADCKAAIQSVVDPVPRRGVLLTAEGGPVLMAKLYTRLGRALLKQGRLVEASVSFQHGVEIVDTTVGYATDQDSPSCLQYLSQTKIDAEGGGADCQRLKENLDWLEANGLTSISDVSRSDRRTLLKALSSINSALSISPGFLHLHEVKGATLVSLGRWRELHLGLERYASETVRYDGVFIQDLKEYDEFHRIGEARYLSPKLFESCQTAEELAKLKISTKAVTEVALRLAPTLQPMYLRALRLEERNHHAAAACAVLKDYSILCGAKQEEFSWIEEERKKLDRTVAEKESGDSHFRKGNYQAALVAYDKCLEIDWAGKSQSLESSGGGRLQAVLHCNKAACLLALKKYVEAVVECNAALKIHQNYMKATLRKARCFVRLGRYDEGIAEYGRYIGLVKSAREEDTFVSSPCIFDGPKDVSDSDLQTAKEELKEAESAKMHSDSAKRAEAAKREQREKFFQETFGVGGTAQNRRDQWYNQTSQGGADPRRWDSFRGRAPRSRSGTNDGSPEEPPGGNPAAGSSGANNSKASRGGDSGAPGSGRAASRSASPVDHYSVLNVSRTASDSEIKKAYRQIALKYHPDKNPDPGAVDIFRQGTAAYETLSDREKRREYDNGMLRARI